MAFDASRAAARDSRITAVLGPTNTGKTYLAIERMLAHRSGMIGFPLRLLARENYERVARVKGRDAVALITGEERILPKSPAYYVCTVEAMPVDKPVAFLAVDEIQLCADPERGHVFTDRLLRARGLQETMFLGSDTIRPILQKLVPGIEFVERPRFSKLSYAGAKKLTRLPRRSAVVAFSAADVYAIAELVRRQRGGAAVVMGALSPRTRNAQVALYQSGEVDYLVATDAIGMGLNMDVDHVAFARMRKFDGIAPRMLRAHEVAQIAGRAGRHLSDGTFGVTDVATPPEPEMIEAVENHQFEALRAVMWRNPNLDFRSPHALLRSLEAHAPHEALIRMRESDDQGALQALARDAEIADMARGPAAVRLLWEVCQIPDFRKIMSDQHARLLGQIYRYLMANEGRLPQDWVGAQVARLDRVDGDIDALTQRIAHIRTWTYVANRGGWLADAAHWRERTRDLEDRLSDALHERLTQRFIDRRSAMLTRSLKEGRELFGAVDAAGAVQVEGEHVGHLSGFAFQPDVARHGEDSRALIAAARRALKPEIASRVRHLETADAGRFALAPDGLILWDGAPVARLAAGGDPLSPRLQPPSCDDMLDSGQRLRVLGRAGAWLETRIRETLAPLFGLRAAELSAPARGIAFQVAEGLGLAPRAPAEPLLRQLAKSDRKALAELGLRIGPTHLWLQALIRPEAMALRALLAQVAAGRADIAPIKGDGQPARPSAGAQADAAMSYVTLGDRAVRVDRFEKLAVTAMTAKDGLAATPELAKLVGGDPATLEACLRRLGYRERPGEDGAPALWRRPRAKPARPPRKPRRPEAAKAEAAPADAAKEAPTKRLRSKPASRRQDEPRPDSPFAVLAQLKRAAGRR